MRGGRAAGPDHPGTGSAPTVAPRSRARSEPSSLGASARSCPDELQAVGSRNTRPQELADSERRAGELFDAGQGVQALGRGGADDSHGWDRGTVPEVLLERRLMLITGQEGVGKSTVIRALLPRLHQGAAIDAEDVGQVNPWIYDDAFRELHRRNVGALVENFWAAGYANVVAGSFFETLTEYRAFRTLLTQEPVAVVVVELAAAKAERDRRRTTRAKITNQEWRDLVDRAHRPDESLSRSGQDAGFRFVSLDTTALDLTATVAQVVAVAPRMFQDSSRN
jgi:hypothetical protein